MTAPKKKRARKVAPAPVELTPAQAIAAAQRTGNTALVAQVRRELGLSAALDEVA